MDNSVGYVLLAAAGVPLVFGFVLSIIALRKSAAAVADAKTVVAQAEVVVSADAANLSTTEVAEVRKVANNLNDTIASATDSLEGMTGLFAPARVFLAMSLVLTVGALMALKVIVVATGAG